ncbi:MAG: hypothetical protein JO297_06385 [Nitrososphaeraceae archaeon]|nr:hypothetical protein [Nitrososphaeraceae archaeon]
MFLWMQNTLSVAIITSALLAAVLFTGQTAKAQATSPGVSPQQAGKTISSNIAQATSNPDVAAELNMGKQLVCGSAAVLNGPSGLLVGSVCNSLVAKLNGASQPSSLTKPSGTSQPSTTTSSASKGTQPSSSKKSVSTSQPSTASSLLQQEQPLCSDGLPPDANGNCPTPSSNNNQHPEQQQTQECPLGPDNIPDCPTTNSNPQPSENIHPSEPGSNSNGGESSSDNVGSSHSGEGENGNNPSSP